MIGLTLATFVLVFLRAWQQQNVTHGWYVWAALTSFGIAFADVLVIVGAARHGLDAAPWIGAGGAVGVTAAMKLHKRMRKNG